MELDDDSDHLGRPWLDSWDGAYRVEAEGALSAARHGFQVCFQGNRPTKTGKSMWWDVILSPAVEDNGRLVVVERDISSRKEYETTLKRDVTEEMEHKRQLGQLQKMEALGILAVSRGGEHQRLPIQIAPIVREAMHLIRASLPSMILIEKDINDGLEPVNADSIQILQIVMDLCTNANHAMSDTGGFLRVELDPREKTVPGGVEHIFIIDDEQPIVDILESTLHGLGYKVTACTNSVDALASFAESPATYDLLITDMTMPHMTGDNLSQHIRSVRPDIPILICTGFSHLLDEEKVISLGINELLMKPIERGALAEAVRNALDSNT